MKAALSLMWTLLLVAGNRALAQANNTEPNRALFTGGGSNPAWSVLYLPENIRFVRGRDTIWMPPVAPELAQDVSVQRYHIQTESGEMIMSLIPGGCPGNNSGQSHLVTILYKRGIDQEFKEYKGCGTLYPDQRLHDIYVVQKNGDTRLDATRKLPVLEFHLSDNKLLGNTGCNTMSASVKVEGPILHLGMARTSRKACPNTYERELLTALAPGAYYYHFSEGLLVLERKGKPGLLLQKTD